MAAQHGCPRAWALDKLGRLFKGLQLRRRLQNAQAKAQPIPARASGAALAPINFGEWCGGRVPAAAPYRHANAMLWFLSGIERMRLPVAAKNALSTAGAATKIVGSPTPPQNPPDGITIDSTRGISLMRIELYS